MVLVEKIGPLSLPLSPSPLSLLSFFFIQFLGLTSFCESNECDRHFHFMLAKMRKKFLHKKTFCSKIELLTMLEHILEQISLMKDSVASRRGRLFISYSTSIWGPRQRS